MNREAGDPRWIALDKHITVKHEITSIDAMGRPEDNRYSIFFETENDLMSKHKDIPGEVNMSEQVFHELNSVSGSSTNDITTTFYQSVPSTMNPFIHANDFVNPPEQHIFHTDTAAISTGSMWLPRVEHIKCLGCEYRFASKDEMIRTRVCPGCKRLALSMEMDQHPLAVPAPFHRPYNSAHTQLELSEIPMDVMNALASESESSPRRKDQAKQEILPDSPPALTKPKRVQRRKSATRFCSVEGCDRGVRSRGLCKGHGGGRRCKSPHCGLSDQGGGFCIRHGGGKRCSFDGCRNSSQSRGLCKKHGGGTRCKFEGCPRSSQGNGLCRSHGGGNRCMVDGCNKTDRRSGFCINHGADRQCRAKNCNKTGRNEGYCCTHFVEAQYREVYGSRLLASEIVSDSSSFSSYEP